MLCTLYSIAHFAPWNTLHPRVFCSLEHFAPKPHLLPRAYLIQKRCFYYKVGGRVLFYVFHLMVKWIPRSIMCLGAKSSREENVFRSKVFHGGNGAEEQRVPGSKVCWEAKCSKQLNIPWGKVCWGVNCNKPIWRKLFLWAKVNNAKCSQKVKCILMQSVHQPP